MNFTASDRLGFFEHGQPACAAPLRRNLFARKDAIRLYMCLCLAIVAATAVATWAAAKTLKAENSAYDLSLQTDGVTTIYKQPYDAVSRDLEVPAPAQSAGKLISI